MRRLGLHEITPLQRLHRFDNIRSIIPKAPGILKRDGLDNQAIDRSELRLNKRKIVMGCPLDRHDKINLKG
jgi:hypothetical protein